MKKSEIVQEPFLIAKTQKGKYKVVRHDGTTVVTIPLANGEASKSIALTVVEALKDYSSPEEDLRGRISELEREAAALEDRLRALEEENEYLRFSLMR